MMKSCPIGRKAAKNRMSTDDLQLYRLKFSCDDFRKLSEEEQLFFIRLAHVADDLRHVSYLCVQAERGSRSTSSDERKLGLHQLLFGVRLIYSILNEAWRVIQTNWYGQQLSKKWDSRLNDKAKQGLKFLGRYFEKNDNLCETIRNQFGFHYSAEQLREPLAHLPNRAAEIITGKHSANVFYAIAEEVRALGLLQAAQPIGAKKMWDKTICEEEIRAAAIKLYKDYRPALTAFEDFANDFLVKVVKSLRPKTEKFSPPRVTKFSDMQPVLFVEEPKS